MVYRVQNLRSEGIIAGEVQRINPNKLFWCSFPSGSYSFVGGLGSTFYVSYANALITFVILSFYIVELFYLPDEADLPFGSLGEIYEKVAALQGRCVYA